MKLENHAALDELTLAELQHIVAPHRQLRDVAAWGASQVPPRMADDIVIQDEFSHDLVIHFRDALHLAYGIT